MKQINSVASGQRSLIFWNFDENAVANGTALGTNDLEGSGYYSQLNEDDDDDD